MVIDLTSYFKLLLLLFINDFYLGELSFGGKWAPKLTKDLCNSSNWVEEYEIVMDKYTF